MNASEILDQMLEAVAAERVAVRKALGGLDGQTAAALRDGVRLVGEPGAHVYRFECDLDFLVADGLRVQVLAPGVIDAGEVVDHDPALGHIGFVLREDLGELVPEAKLVFDSTWLLDLLTTHLQAIRASIGPDGSPGALQVERALAFLEGTVPARPPVAVARGALSESQNRAVSFVVGQEAAYLWGPPGTGKTQTVAHLVHELVERGDRVLLAAHTNVATDTALLRVLREKALPPRQVVRVGYCGEELRPFGVGLDELADAVLRDRFPAEAKAMEHFCGLVAGQATRPPAVLTTAGAALPRRFRVAFELLPQLALMEEAQVRARAADLDEVLLQVERELVDRAAVVSATLTRLYTSRLLRGYKADSVVIDEASIASLVLSFVAACCAKKRTVAVGDFMQLPAIVQAEQIVARIWLGRHVFASARCDRPDQEHPLRAMLDEQWRMHPQISRVVSRLFYAGKLEEAPAVRTRAHAGPALLILDTGRLRPAAQSETVSSGSKLNRAHAELVARLVGKARRTGVAVIAPYRAQVRAIREAVRGAEAGRLKSGEVEIFTVHRFQGRDKDLVIFDLVEAPGTRARFVDELRRKEAPNLINVAMSRARERLVVVAHLPHLAGSLGRRALVNRLFAQMREAGALEVVAGDPRDEAVLDQFLEDPRMEILATEAFLERAREHPGAVREHLHLVVSSPPPPGAPMATELADRRVLGWSVRERKLALWYMVEPEEALGAAGEPALSSMSKAELRDLGVDDALVRSVQRARTVAELQALGLPGPIEQRLRFRLIQQRTGLGASEDELKYAAPDLRHLDRFLRGDLSQLLLNLDPSQRAVVELGGHGPIVVRGVAGSGKTAVALHRIYDCLKQRSLLAAPRVLFLTFNRALASVAAELLAFLGLRPDDVEVSTLHRWCMGYLPQRPRVATPEVRRDLVRQAVAWMRQSVRGSPAEESAVWSYPLQFWADELHRIKSTVLGGAEEYAALYRYGAGRPLDQRLRQHVWIVCQAYRDLLRQSGQADWDDVVRLVFDRLRSQGPAAPRYDHVLVDEAQDLTVMAMRVAAALCKPEGTLLVSYDPAQSIYERGFRWKSYGITVHGSRSFDLRRNYRNTAEILAAARPLLAGMRDTLDTGEAQPPEEVFEPEQARRHGVAPRLLPVEAGRECQEVARDVARLIELERVPPQNIAVLCYPNAVRDRMSRALERAGILHQQHDDDSVIRVRDTSVKVLPLKSAKGLEFPVVYVLATGASFQPPFDGESEQAAWHEQMGRCFYMALTRAMSRLVIVYARRDPVRYLKPLLGGAGLGTRPPA